MEKKKPTIYTSATAHLDTVWLWSFEKTIKSYIPRTLDDNFKLFEKYPDYVFSFEGSRRYELMEEYYPEKFQKLKEYVANNRWFVTGSAYENGDVNVPSPEALFRNIIYGNGYFNEKFGKKSVDIYLPDCFGFGYALPSIIKHAGLYGFTTQKLSWGSAYGVPFDLGYWQGVDGSKIYASLDAQPYISSFTDVRAHKDGMKKLENNIEKYDLPMTHILHGTGDRGGAPEESSVKAVSDGISKNERERTDVKSASVDEIFRVMDEELSDEQKNKLPVWNNELTLTDHGVGGYTSRAIGKRWNKQNEQLADAAERFSAAAMWLGAAKYPQNVLDTAWKRVIAHQFHDDLPGTSLNCVYQRTWNEYVLSLNQFAGVYERAVSRIVSQMNVPFKRGFAVAVTNPTGWASEGAVSCRVPLTGDVRYVHVKNAKGKAVPSQYENGEVTFSASVPANGIALYCITAADKPYSEDTGLRITKRTVENKKYSVRLSDDGDIASVFDKSLQKELLKAPVSMDMFKYNGSTAWPSWELDYSEVMASPCGKASSPEFEIVSDGPAKVAIKTTRKSGKSVFVQTVSLSDTGSTVRVDNEIEWESSRRLLKTPFTFTVSNENASYDLGLGVIKRKTNTPKIYEVPGQNFADISSAEYGVSVLSDCKFGWDHPTADTLRLTGIHTPRGDFSPFANQSKMELGKNRYAFGIFSHEGDDLTGTQTAGAQFCQPMRVFAAPLANEGVLMPEFSFGSLSDDGVILRAVKKEQNGDRIIVRVNEGTGVSHKDVALSLGSGIAEAYEMNASEDVLKKAAVKKGELIFNIAPYEPKTFALVLKDFNGDSAYRESERVRLNFNASVTSPNEKREDGIIYGATVPSEQWGGEVICKNDTFTLSNEKLNAMRCCGQTLQLPSDCKKVSLLLTSLKGDKTVALRSGDKKTTVFVPDCCENIGAWDLYAVRQKGYIKQCSLAKEFTHLHNADGDIIAKQCYLFSVTVPVEGGMLSLPVDENLLVFAAQASFDSAPTEPLSPLYDTLEKEKFEYKRSSYENIMTALDKPLAELKKNKYLNKLVEKL